MKDLFENVIYDYDAVSKILVNKFIRFIFLIERAIKDL